MLMRDDTEIVPGRRVIRLYREGSGGRAPRPRRGGRPGGAGGLGRRLRGPAAWDGGLQRWSGSSGYKAAGHSYFNLTLTLLNPPPGRAIKIKGRLRLGQAGQRPSLRAPAPPHRAVHSFDLAGESRRIHQRRGFHPCAQAAAQFAKPRQIVAQFCGNLHVLVFRKCHHLRQAKVCQLAVTRTRDCLWSGETDDRHAHPERIEARRVTIVGKGIEGDVEPMIQLEVIPARTRLDEFDAVRSDPRLLQDREGPSLPMAAKTAEQDQTAVLAPRPAPAPRGAARGRSLCRSCSRNQRSHGRWRVRATR